jgi:hypothetical protein
VPELLYPTQTQVLFQASFYSLFQMGATEMKPFIEFPFPLRPGQLAYLKIPVDLTQAEVKKIEDFMLSLVKEEPPK